MEAQVELPAGEPTTSSESSPIQNSDAGPDASRLNLRSSSWRNRPRPSFPAVPVVSIAAAHGKEVNPVARWPIRRKVPHWLQCNDPKNKPWHNYLLERRDEYLADRHSCSSDDSHQTNSAASTGSPRRDKPLPPVPLPPSAANAGTSSTSQQGGQPAEMIPSASSQSRAQSEPARTRPPSYVHGLSEQLFDSCASSYKRECTYRKNCQWTPSNADYSTVSPSAREGPAVHQSGAMVKLVSFLYIRASEPWLRRREDERQCEHQFGLVLVRAPDGTCLLMRNTGDIERREEGGGDGEETGFLIYIKWGRYIEFDQTRKLRFNIDFPVCYVDDERSSMNKLLVPVTCEGAGSSKVDMSFYYFSSFNITPLPSTGTSFVAFHFSASEA
ncbi:hypothetical protein BU15DRAFT_69539 [Melanogaster broomeanus]|nr:hypothetical protein BU15DRAFT_69539 [Melanogaster broomeanus]